MIVTIHPLLPGNGYVAPPADSATEMLRTPLVCGLERTRSALSSLRKDLSGALRGEGGAFIERAINLGMTFAWVWIAIWFP